LKFKLKLLPPEKVNDGHHTPFFGWKMKIVLDTNVFISALINPHGHPASILNLIISDDIKILIDNRIIEEYRTVLSRKKFKFKETQYNPLLDYISENGIFILAKPINAKFSDEDDKVFYEVALSGEANYLVTGNIKHFPKEAFVVTPAEFIEILSP
jgi:uncharacterized protein